MIDIRRCSKEEIDEMNRKSKEYLAQKEKPPEPVNFEFKVILDEF